MADSLRFVLDFAAKTAGLKDAAALADLLGDELDDTTDAGKAMAAALAAAAAKAEKDLADTVEMADKLGAALGPELSGKMNLDQIAADMRAVGMTTEQVDANIDSFRASLSQMANTADQAKARMGDLDNGVRRVGDSTDRSRSVMANFTGNAMQEIPGLTGAFGPLNMAIGQFAEYGAEGNINLKSMAGQVGPMAGIGAAIWYATKQMERMAKTNAFHSERVKGYQEAIEESGDAVANLADHLREVGKVEAETLAVNHGNPWADATVDITDGLRKAGLTVDQYAQLVVQGTEAQKAWGDQMRASGADAQEVFGIQVALADASDDYTKAAANAARSAQFFGKTLMSEVYPATEDVSKAFDRAGRAYDKFMGKLDQEDAVANATLALEGLEAQLADIQERYDKGEITGREAFAETVLATNGATSAIAETVKGLGFLNTALAEKFEVLVETGQIDEAQRKMEWLIQLAALLRNPDWFGTNVGRSSSGGGPRTPSVDGGAASGGGAPASIVVNVSALNATAETGRLVADSLAAHYRTGGQRL